MADFPVGAAANVTIEAKQEAEAAHVPAGGVRIPPFAPIRQDGRVHAGRSNVDESAATGAILPVLKQAGDLVLAGSRNGAGELILLTDGNAATAPAFISGDQPSKDPLGTSLIGGNFPGDLLGPFLPSMFRRILVINLAILAAIILRWVSREQDFTAVNLSLAVLGLLPPALFLVWPLQQVALRQWLKSQRLYCPDLSRLHGLLRIKRLVFGRHGTISEGHLRIVSLQPSPGVTPAEMMVLGASAHQHTEDIWGKAFMVFGISHRIHLRPAEKVLVEPGLGLSAEVDNKSVLVGSATWLEEHGIAIVGLEEAVEEHRRLGREMLFVGIAGREPRSLGVIALADPPRNGASGLIRTCKQSGIETVLIGDITQAATHTLAGLAGVGRVVPKAESGQFDDETSLVVAQACDAGLLERYDNAVGLGEPAVRRSPHLPFGVLRNDTRHVLDFVVLAQVLSRRLPLTLILVWVSGWPLVVAGLGLLPVPPIVRLSCLAVGLIIAAVIPQLLRLVDSLANDEHED